MGRMKRPDERDKRILRVHYTGKSANRQELAIHLGVGRRTIERWAHDMGLTRSRSHGDATKKWRPIANISGPTGFTGRTLAAWLNVPHQTITEWVKKHWLPNRRRKTSTSENPYAFTDTDVGLLVVAHWQEVFPDGPSMYQSETLNEVLPHAAHKIESDHDTTRGAPAQKRQAARSVAARGGPGGDARWMGG